MLLNRPLGGEVHAEVTSEEGKREEGDSGECEHSHSLISLVGDDLIAMVASVRTEARKPGTTHVKGIINKIFGDAGEHVERVEDIFHMVIHVGLILRLSLCWTTIETRATYEVDLGLVAHIPDNFILVNGLPSNGVFESDTSVKIIAAQAVDYAFYRCEGPFVRRQVTGQYVH